MTKLSRRQLFAASAAAGVASVVPTAKAHLSMPVEEAKRAAESPASVKEAALFQPKSMPANELSLTGTFELGKSTLNEGTV